MTEECLLCKLRNISNPPRDMIVNWSQCLRTYECQTEVKVGKSRCRVYPRKEEDDISFLSCRDSITDATMGLHLNLTRKVQIL